ncbi:MAG: TlpA family protein disulfide reductase [Actinobacteria bacterium]|nr:TlpA family protein disulfide reductase [Actinomycetota bacterium]
MQEELAGHGFTVFAIAVDESPDHARPWVEEAGCTFPVVYDADRLAVEALGIINVPTVVWIDEDGRVVRPHDAQFPNDNLIVFHGKPAAPHLDALRRWVVDGEAPMTADEVRAAHRLPTEDEQLARAHFRVGLQLLRRGEEQAAADQFARAGELSPDDWTIRRASLLLTGKDPFFSEEFLAMFQAWQDAGRPGYALR